MRRWLCFLARCGYAAGSVFYLFTFGSRSVRRRARISGISAHFGFYPDRDRILPRWALAEFAPDDVAIPIRAPESFDGRVSLHELLAVIRLVA